MVLLAIQRYLSDHSLSYYYECKTFTLNGVCLHCTIGDYTKVRALKTSNATVSEVTFSKKGHFRVLLDYKAGLDVIKTVLKYQNA